MVQTNTPIPKDEVAVIKINGQFIDTTHNFPCPICHKNKAMLQGNKGIFMPCRECEKNNWFTVKINSKFIRWLLGLKEYWYRSVK
jgi:hypothetical protein